MLCFLFAVLWETQRLTGRSAEGSTWMKQPCGSEEELGPFLGYFWSGVCRGGALKVAGEKTQVRNALP